MDTLDGRAGLWEELENSFEYILACDKRLLCSWDGKKRAWSYVEAIVSWNGRKRMVAVQVYATQLEEK